MEMTKGPLTGNWIKKWWRISKIDFHETTKYSDTYHVYWHANSPWCIVAWKSIQREECKEGFHSRTFIHKCRYLVWFPLSVGNKNKSILIWKINERKEKVILRCSWCSAMTFKKAYCETVSAKQPCSVLKIHTHTKYANVCIHTQRNKYIKVL